MITWDAFYPYFQIWFATVEILFFIFYIFSIFSIFFKGLLNNHVISIHGLLMALLSFNLYNIIQYLFKSPEYIKENHYNCLSYKVEQPDFWIMTISGIVLYPIILSVLTIFFVTLYPLFKYINNFFSTHDTYLKLKNAHRKMKNPLYLFREVSLWMILHIFMIFFASMFAVNIIVSVTISDDTIAESREKIYALIEKFNKDKTKYSSAYKATKKIVYYNSMISNESSRKNSLIYGVFVNDIKKEHKLIDLELRTTQKDFKQ